MTPPAGVVTVLVVDDEEPIRNALRKYLKQQQFEVHAAGSADEALQQLRMHKVALMLSDIRMPGTSGVDLVPQALEIEPDLAILMLTAVNDATSAALCMQRGAMDYLTKPIELAGIRIFGQPPAPEVLNSNHRRDSRAITLRGHEDAPAFRREGIRHP